jgi:cyclophilin family peptidyl-prolyl cis-trans isomerase
MFKKTSLILMTLCIIGGCHKNDNCKYVKISTEKGDIVIRLYNETPKHRDNFVKLSSTKFYDGQIFHRIINNFVVQGGDPKTKNPLPDYLYGNTDSGYLLDAEFVDSLIHKRGAVGMARDGDDINPEKKSSGSQFYIVKGKVYTNDQLNELERKKDNQKKSKLYRELILEKLKNTNNQTKTDTVSISLDVSVAIDSIWETYPKFKFSEKQRKVYTTTGGLPHLDGNYTVFGEVVSGMDIIDLFSTVNTDQNNRPLKDIHFSTSVIK